MDNWRMENGTAKHNRLASRPDSGQLAAIITAERRDIKGRKEVASALVHLERFSLPPMLCASSDLVALSTGWSTQGSQGVQCKLLLPKFKGSRRFLF
ncbi:hypothetical protein SNOG_02831 [Parastagonospora nodorum SN15]|uniref:Uncharacterized protein n=1 Tax=Phaeosphaeria nodorum (strain SN15 / ATCC MYA-4574 / FGSC 10173) TaxID=321614 RepID=Q0UZI3_PHANO|nr:hypothetical protein SNOG_02831 [Parastagonospora nodorum SN15]EAT89562.1 hypothetical protein SNOG_02831 [Parastagonospora nodorum SN15]